MWDTVTGDLVWQQSGHEAFVEGLDISSDGSLLVSSSDTPPIIILWDAETGEQLHKFDGHSDWVNNVSFNPGGTLLASTSADYTARLWNLEGTSIISVEHPLPVWGIAFHPDGDRFATSPWDQSRVNQGDELPVSQNTELIPDERVVIWDLDSGEQVTNLGPLKTEVRDLAFSQDGDLLAAGD
jgi:WD40 repeat protein